MFNQNSLNNDKKKLNICNWYMTKNKSAAFTLILIISEPNSSQIDIQLDPTFIDEKVRSKKVAKAVLNHYINSILQLIMQYCWLTREIAEFLIFWELFLLQRSSAWIIYNFEEGFFEFRPTMNSCIFLNCSLIIPL
jgi:hypothetical protein